MATIQQVEVFGGLTMTFWLLNILVIFYADRIILTFLLNQVSGDQSLKGAVSGPIKIKLCVWEWKIDWKKNIFDHSNWLMPIG